MQNQNTIKLLVKKTASVLAIGFVFSSGAVVAKWSDWHLTPASKEAFSLLDASAPILDLKDKVDFALAPWTELGIRNQESGIMEGKVAGTKTTASDSEAVLSKSQIATSTSSPRNGDITQVIREINNYTVQASLNESELVNLISSSQTLKALLKGDKGDPGQAGEKATVSYTLPTSSNTNSMGSIGGFTHLSGNDLTTQNISVTNNATFNSVTLTSCTGCNSSWSSIIAPTTNLSLAMAANTSTFTWNAATGANNLFNLADTNSNTGTGYLLNLTTGTGSTLKPLHISAAGVEAITVLANANVGIGTTNPNLAKLHLVQSGSGTTRGIFVDQTGTGTAYGINANVLGASTTNTGFYADVENGGSNYGIQIVGTPSGANNYAIYASAAAQNYFAGNVGIGTTGPASTLHLEAANFVDLTLKESGREKVIVRGQGSGSGSRIAIQTHDGTSLAERFAIEPNGAVAFTTSVDSFTSGIPGWKLNDTDTKGGFLSIQKGGTPVISIGSGRSLHVSLSSTAGVIMSAAGQELIIGGNGDPFTNGFAMGANYFRPVGDSGATLGGVSNRWANEYFLNAPILGSDVRLKKNIIDSPLGLDFINSLRPVSYNWIADDGKTHFGMIAQEVDMIAPAGSAFVNKSNPDSYGMAYDEFISPIIEALQELSDKVVVLQSNTGQIGSWTIDENGILTAEKIQAKEICFDEICLDKEKVKTLLQNNGLMGNVAGESVPAEEPAPEPAPEPVPEPIPELQPAPEEAAP